MRFVVLFLLVGAIAEPVAAQQAAGLPRGEIVEKVASRSDATETYALYLPTSYDGDGPAPVVILMDPRGRALIPMEGLRHAAEELGYILLSSYQTLSDDPDAFEVNRRALDALWTDAGMRFEADSNRLYLAGFSGTAHYAWHAAPGLDGALAGILGVGGGLPTYSRPIQQAMVLDRPFAFFGVAGYGDFNFDGVRLLDAALDTTRLAHRFVSHDGDHQWPAEDILSEALRWFELRAVQRGWSTRPEEWIEDRYDEAMQQARDLEDADRVFDAMRRYREIAQDFEGLTSVQRAEKRRRRLAASNEVERQRLARELAGERVLRYKAYVRDYYTAYRTADPFPSHQDALEHLRIDELKREAGSDDLETSGAARRMLASAFANTGFYEPRDYMAAKDYARAAAMLRIALEISSDQPFACYRLAQAEAQLGNLDAARDALACAREADWFDEGRIRRDTLLAPVLNQQQPADR